MAAGVKFRYTGSGSSSNPGLSLGGVTTGGEIGTPVINNLFDNISASEAAAGGNTWGQGDGLDVRCIAIENSGDLILYNIKIWSPSTSSLTSSPDTWFTMAIDPNSVGNTQSVADESKLPSSPDLNFALRASEDDAITVSSLNVGSYIRLWIKRKLTEDSDAFSQDIKTIYVRAQVTSS